MNKKLKIFLNKIMLTLFVLLALVIFFRGVIIQEPILPELCNTIVNGIAIAGLLLSGISGYVSNK